MFRRSKSDTAESTIDETEAERVSRTQPKGRPTPTRKEAEEAAKMRARAPRNRKEQAARDRAVRGESSAKVRAGMKSGDERYLTARDQGPVRRFCRDYVDSKMSVLELAIPLLVVSLVLGYAGAPVLSEAVMFSSLLVLAVECFRLRRRMRIEVSTRFPDAELRGLTYYTLSRATALRFMRMPKAKLKRGDPLDERYR